MNWLNSLIDEMESYGLAPADGVIADGNLHRFRVDGDKPGSKNGWYRIYADDHPAAVFGSWKAGERYTWRATEMDRHGSLSRPWATHDQIAAERQRRQAAEAQGHVDAAIRARKIWDAAIEPDPRHQYLRGKAIGVHGIRQHGDALAVPLRDVAGKISSLQFIAPDGCKLVAGKINPKGWCLLYAAKPAK